MEDDMSAIKKCKYCHGIMSEFDYVCPNCKMKNLGLIKYPAFILLFIIIIAIFIPTSENTDYNASNTISQDDNLKAEISNSINDTTIQPTKILEEVKHVAITSSELIDSFNANSVKCKQLYDKENIEVTGTVQSIGETVWGNVYVSLGHDNEFTFVGIQCFAKNDSTVNKIAELLEGDEITIRGVCDVGSLSISLEKAEILD